MTTNHDPKESRNMMIAIMAFSLILLGIAFAMRYYNAV